MKLAEVTLVTRDIEPGWPLVGDDVPLGRTYTVDLDTVHGMIVVNRATGQQKELAGVLVLSPGPPGYMPVLAFGMQTHPQVSGPPLPLSQVRAVCWPTSGPTTCSFLLKSADDYYCAKGTLVEISIHERRQAGTMKAMGDNCSGPPEFRRP